MSGCGRPAPAALLAILLLAAALALAACGGDDDEGGGNRISESDVEDAGLNYARCMREHGIDMPDPQPGRGLRGLFDPDRAGDPDFRAADGEYRKHLQGLFSEIDDDQRREIEDARLEFARCVRAKGFDVPDPERGAGPQEGGPLGELDLNDPAVQDAMDACRESLPSFGGGG
jgi:hypothetical protein